MECICKDCEHEWYYAYQEPTLYSRPVGKYCLHCYRVAKILPNEVRPRMMECLVESCPHSKEGVQ